MSAAPSLREVTTGTRNPQSGPHGCHVGTRTCGCTWAPGVRTITPSFRVGVLRPTLRGQSTDPPELHGSGQMSRPRAFADLLTSR